MKFEVEKYTLTIYGEDNEKALLILNEDHNEGDEIWNLLPEDAKNQLTMACISGVNWEHDLSPWEAPALFKKADPFTGGADEYFEKLVSTMIPDIQNKTNHIYERVLIAGYSLAGLFATYAAIKANFFDGFVSASGSLWYPDFLSYVKEHPLPEKVKIAYFSIGDKESKTKNSVMRTVEENTREIEGIITAQGVKTKFDLNQGGHFKDDSKRLAKGIEWIVSGGGI